MMDHSLGTDVENCGEPPTLGGKPLHKGECSDGVYGCRHCHNALRHLTDEQRLQYDAEYPQTGEYSRSNWVGHCDWCKKATDISKLWLHRPWDEPSCEYEVCGPCIDRNAYDPDVD